MKGAPVVLLIAAGCAALIVVWLLMRWMIRANRSPNGPEQIVAVLVLLVVLESALYQNQDTIPTSFFHLQAGSLSFRLYDVLVPLAVIARLIARPQARLRSAQLILWSAFLGWYLFEAISGLLGGNPKDFVSYEAKLIIYLGFFVLVAAVPARRWLDSRVLHRMVIACSVLAAVFILTDVAGLAIDSSNPIVPLVQFGVLGPDAATAFVILGIPTLAVGLCSERERLRTILVAVPLVAAPLVANQRASLLELVASVVVLGLVLAPRRRLVRIGAGDLGLLVAAIVAAAALLLVVSAAVPSAGIKVPLASSLNATFNSQEKVESGQDRINQWAQARHLFVQRPVFGWGLGVTYEYYSPGFYAFMPTDLTHNIEYDLLIRTGVVGLLLFAIAWLASLRDLWAAMRAARDPRMMALAAGALAAFVGVIVHGQFESIFEKYRIAMMLGLLAGVSLSFASGELEEARDRRRTSLGASAADDELQTRELVPA